MRRVGKNIKNHKYSRGVIRRQDLFGSSVSFHSFVLLKRSRCKPPFNKFFEGCKQILYNMKQLLLTPQPQATNLNATDAIAFRLWYERKYKIKAPLYFDNVTKKALVAEFRKERKNES